MLSRLRHRRNIGCWRRLQLDVARRAGAVAVCSEMDRGRLGVANAVVVPNGYQLAGPPVGRIAVGDPPVIAFVGFLPYAPNFDAAGYLARTIAPLVRAKLPSVQVRLVGFANDDIMTLHDPPRVVVTGYVPDVATELRAADLLAVPIRFGGGTRIKVLEGFAHRIPVVATTIGAEGIEATDEVEIMLRDEPQGFAEACVRLLRDAALRHKITEAAHALFRRKYRWEAIQERVAAVAMAVAAVEVRGTQVAFRATGL